MKVWAYERGTGELVGESAADESPLEPGVFLVPANATTIEPPARQPGKAPVFLNGAWEQVDDKRGETWFTSDGTNVVVAALGNPADAGLLSECPPRHPTAYDVTRERDRRMALGFDHDFGDARGVVHIPTSPSDMQGWAEVTQAANAMIALGMGASSITIQPGETPIAITAEEWQRILLRAAQVRQPIWFASFALQAASPIPDDFADDRHWH